MTNMNELKEQPTQSELHRLFDYKDGKLYWRVARGCKSIGDEAGGLNRFIGYHIIGLNGKLYRTHRLIWLYMYGKMPDNEIDHINHDTTDNRIENLREVTHKENESNRSMSKNNTSGFNGVTLDKNSGKWRVMVIHDNQRIWLGAFTDKETACNLSYNAHLQLGFHSNHGELNV